MQTPETEASQVAVSNLRGCQKGKGPVWQEHRKRWLSGRRGGITGRAPGCLVGHRGDLGFYLE